MIRQAGDTHATSVQGLPTIMAEAIGRNIEDIYRSSNRGILSEVELLQSITEACRDCVNEFVKGEFVSV